MGTNTGGGANVGGDANVGRDFTGRDHRTDEQSGNVINNYLDHNNPNRSERRQTITLDERLGLLEKAANEQNSIIERFRRLMDGDTGVRFIGLLDQMAANAVSDKLWKDATEKRILAAEDRIDKLEGGKKFIVGGHTAWLYVIIAILLAIVLWLALSYFQNPAAISQLAAIIEGVWYV